MKTIHDHNHQFCWDHNIEPVMYIDPDTTLKLEMLDAAGGRITKNADASAVLSLDPAFANPITGPVFIDGAEPGDTVKIEVIDFELSHWGWTAIIPGFGLLPEAFPEPFLHHSSYSETTVEFTPEIAIPTRPFAGTIGLAPAEPGKHSTIPPHTAGGNLDCRDLTRGATLYLPVQVPGALFSVGDGHAAQADGEVCGTAIETPLAVVLKFSLIKQQNLKFPQLAFTNTQTQPQPNYVTMGVSDDLYTAAKDAIRAMIDHLTTTYGLSAELAYCLCSLAVDLKITEIVNAPNWVVSAYLNESIFV